jgi:V/A-type H+-transporting ATPase subunit K
MDFAMAGPAIVLGLGCIGSAIGCGIAGMAAHAVMTRVDDNHGKFIGMSAIPSSQSLYAFILMIVMRNAIRANALSPMSAVVIGAFVGAAVLISAVYQGMCCATGIQSSAKQPALYGKCLIPIGIVESFSLFAFVFALLLL